MRGVTTLLVLMLFRDLHNKQGRSRLQSLGQCFEKTCEAKLALEYSLWEQEIPKWLKMSGHPSREVRQD